MATEHEIRGLHATVIETLLSTFAHIGAEYNELGILPTEYDIVGEADPEFGELIRHSRTLCEFLVSELLSGNHSKQLGPIESDARDALNDAARAAGVRMHNASRAAAMIPINVMIHEIGVERYRAQCLIDRDPRGERMILTSEPVSEATAHSLLTERLFHRVDHVTSADDFSLMECMAAAWYFQKWGSTSDPRRSDSPYSVWVREREWMMVSRDTFSFEEPMMAAFIDDESFASVPPRQQRLASAYLGSTVDIFQVVDVDGPLMMLRSTRDGMTYRVNEHDREARPKVGLLVLGRLIQFDDDLWLRSPGALIISPFDDAHTRSLTELFATLSEQLPTPIALEALIAGAIFGLKTTELLPAPSAAEAEGLVQSLYEHLDDLGLTEELPPTETLSGLFLTAGEQAGVRFALDQPLAEFAEALVRQVEAGDEPPPGFRRPKSGKHSGGRKAAAKKKKTKRRR